MRRIAVVTTARADYGLLYWLMREIEADPELELQLVVSGAHLSPAHGMTVRVIEEDGFRIDARIEALLASDTRVGTAKSIALSVAGFAEAFDRLQPDIVVVIGDRYEMFAATEAAYVLGFPIAHIAGGDTTEGAFDEGFRHAMTKMSHIHFVTNESAAARVRRMGEDAARVHVVGSPGLDALKRSKLLPREELGFDFRERNLLITFHPVTVGGEPDDIRELLAALDSLGPDVGLIFTMPNADPAGHEIQARIDDFVASHPNARSFAALGQQKYLSMMNVVDAVVGNSSSGLAEAPSMEVATVNIGDRQKGRPAAASVIDCRCTRQEIAAAIRKAMEMDCRGVVNPYGAGEASIRIKEELKRIPSTSALLRKHFSEDMNG